jgi:hypothetical protein
LNVSFFYKFNAWDVTVCHLRRYVEKASINKGKEKKKKRERGGEREVKVMVSEIHRHPFD